MRKKLTTELHPNGLNIIVIDSVTAQVLSVEDTQEASPSARLLNLRYPFHIGRWGGEGTGDILSCLLQTVVGLSLPLYWGSSTLPVH